PRAAIPVVQVTLPVAAPASKTKLGEALAPLRERGVLLIGSGGVVHNLRKLDWAQKEAPVMGWAREFDDWVMERVRARDVQGLAEYRQRAPHADLAVPTSEHFDPLFFTLGAAREGDTVTSVYEGFQHGTVSMRSFALG